MKGQMKTLRADWDGGAGMATGSLGTVAGATGAELLEADDGSPARICPWRDLWARALRVGSRPFGSCGTPKNKLMGGASEVGPLILAALGAWAGVTWVGWGREGPVLRTLGGR